MPKTSAVRQPKESPVDLVARWKRESAAIREDLRARRQALAAELALVDQALAELDPQQEAPTRARRAALPRAGAEGGAPAGGRGGRRSRGRRIGA